MKSKLRKIFYVPGMISAIIIPLVFWHLGSEKLKEPIPNLMDFGVPGKYDANNPSDQPNTFESVRHFKYKKIIVKPNSANVNSKYYVSELKKLNERNEKETGIEFVLNDENSYGDFVFILNDFHITKQERYGLDLDKTGHLFAIVDYKDPNVKEINYISICGGVVFDANYYDIDENSFERNYRIFQFQISELPKQAYYIIFSFLFFLQISVLGILRKLI